MLERFYSNKTEKDLRKMFNIYSALLILSLIIPILLSIIAYFMNGKVSLSFLFPFVIVLIWSSLNVDYLKKKLKIN